MNSLDIQEIIDMYSDYDMPEPYWVTLNWFYQTFDEAEYIVDFLENNYPGDMVQESLEYKTAKKYAIKMLWKSRHDLWNIRKEYPMQDILVELIDGSGSSETDCRTIDPETGITLHECPVGQMSTIDEMEILLNDYDELSLCDWRWLDMVNNSFCLDNDEDKKIKELMIKIIDKHHFNKCW